MNSSSSNSSPKLNFVNFILYSTKKYLNKTRYTVYVQILVFFIIIAIYSLTFLSNNLFSSRIFLIFHRPTHRNSITRKIWRV